MKYEYNYCLLVHWNDYDEPYVEEYRFKYKKWALNKLKDFKNYKTISKIEFCKINYEHISTEEF